MSSRGRGRSPRRGSGAKRGRSNSAAAPRASKKNLLDGVPASVMTAVTAVCHQKLDESKPGIDWTADLVKAWDAAVAVEQDGAAPLELPVSAATAAAIMIRRFRMRFSRAKKDILARMFHNRAVCSQYGNIAYYDRQKNERWVALRLSLAACIMGPLALEPTSFHLQLIDNLLHKFTYKSSPAGAATPNKFERKIIKHIRTRMKTAAVLADLPDGDYDEDLEEEGGGGEGEQ